MTLYFQHKEGAVVTSDGWTSWTPPAGSISANITVRSNLQSQGMLPTADTRSGFRRLWEMRPEKPAMVAFAITFGGVLLCTMLRHRFSGWPIHPVFFLTMGAFQSTYTGGSFLIGSLIKYLITHYGGGQLYQKLKPLMIGLAAGEFLAGGIAMIFGLLYYLTTNQPPKPFGIFR
jgi:hypothetical protein